MPPLKPAISQRISTSPRLILYPHSYACFSTSVPRWPRLRPSARPSRILATSNDTHSNELDSTAPSSPLTASTPPKSSNTTSTTSKTTSPHKPTQQAKTTPTIPNLQEPSSSSPSSTPKRSAPPNTKPHKETLFTNTLIRQSSSSPLITTSTTKPQDAQIASAASFFQQGFQFLYSAESLRHHPKNEHIPEVIILGASNVGKSSFLNALVGRLGAARVSARPGKTTLMNAFGLGPLPNIPKGLVRQGEKLPRYSLVLVDTPGYGFKSQASWGDAVWKYIKARKMLRGAVVLLSSEKRLMEQDKWLLRTLAEANTRTLVVLTKADKGGGSWTQRCGDMATLVREELRKMSRSVGNGWEEGSGWNPDIHITAAGMDNVPKLGSGGGVGGVRTSILEMAGFDFDLKEKEVKKKDETVTYGGPVVSFDDIKWKTG
ncbi:putative GTP-binding protein EngB [Trichoderma lentiforme]|uniref:GTP-binding protein EngB n=1 Tax=Trichoderma lentiforme TaxID=1567552 RepID=A0A9P4XF87_9HYPO|nr:putative GTP-binding protein EngB [Trichoderma lentiforme]